MTKLILAITPDTKLLDQISAHLQEGGRFQVFCAASGKEAITLTAKQQFDVAILDAETSDLAFLPLTRELIGLQPGMKLLIFPPQNNPRHPLMSGVVTNGFLNKPFFGPEVNEKLLQLLNVRPLNNNQPSNENDLTSLWVDHPESGQKLVEQLLASTSASGGILLIHRQVAAVAGAIGDNTSQNIINFLTRYWTNIQTGELFRYLKMDSETKTYLVYATPLMKDVAFALIYHTNQSLIEIRSEVSHIRKAFLNRFANTRELSNEFTPIQVEPIAQQAPPQTEIEPSSAETLNLFSTPESQQQVVQSPEAESQSPEDATLPSGETAAIPAEEFREIEPAVIQSKEINEPNDPISPSIEEKIAPISDESPTAEILDAEITENIPAEEIHPEMNEENPRSLSKNEFENLEELSAENYSQESEEEQNGLSPDDLKKLDKLLAEMPAPDPELEPETVSVAEEKLNVEPPPLPIVEPPPLLESVSEPEIESTPDPESMSAPAVEPPPLLESVPEPEIESTPDPESMSAPAVEPPPLLESLPEPEIESVLDPEFMSVPAVELPPLLESVPEPEIESAPDPESISAPAVEQTSESENPSILASEPGWQSFTTEENPIPTDDLSVEPPPLPLNEEQSTTLPEKQTSNAGITAPLPPLPEQTTSNPAEAFPNFDFKLPWEEENSADIPADADQFAGIIPPTEQTSEWLPMDKPVDYSSLTFEFQFLLIPVNPQQLITHDIASLLNKQLPRMHESNGWKCTGITTRPLYMLWSAQIPVDTCIADLTQEIKERTNILIFANFPGLLKDHLNGEFWMPGYFAVSGTQSLSIRLINDTISLIRQIQPTQSPE
jgi:CheY-like chemotaxis protein